MLGAKIIVPCCPGGSGFDAEAISALKSTLAPVLAWAVIANAWGIFPTLITVRLTMSVVLNVSVGPGDVNAVDALPKP